MIAQLAAEAPLTGALQITTVIAEWLVSPVGRVRCARAVDAVDRFNNDDDEPSPLVVSVALAADIEARTCVSFLARVIGEFAVQSDRWPSAAQLDQLAEIAKRWQS